MVHDSIGKALEAVTRFSLPADLGRAVHDAASAAFLSGMRVAVVAGAFVVACAAGVAYRYLPAQAERAVREDADLHAEALELGTLDDGIFT